MRGLQLQMQHSTGPCKRENEQPCVSPRACWSSSHSGNRRKRKHVSDLFMCTNPQTNKKETQEGEIKPNAMVTYGWSSGRSGSEGGVQDGDVFLVHVATFKELSHTGQGQMGSG